MNVVVLFNLELFYLTIQCCNFRTIQMGARNRVGTELSYRPASLCTVLAVRYDSPIPTRFLAPLDRSKIPSTVYSILFYQVVDRQNICYSWALAYCSVCRLLRTKWRTEMENIIPFRQRNKDVTSTPLSSFTPGPPTLQNTWWYTIFDFKKKIFWQINDRYWGSPLAD